MLDLASYTDYSPSTNEDFDSILYKPTYQEASIQQAIEYVTEHRFSFAYYDLGLTEHEKLILNNLDINSYNTLIRSFSTPTLANDIEDFIKTLSSSNKNDDLANGLAAIIIRVTRSIINASGFNDSSVYVYPDMDINSYDSSITHLLNTSALYWHIDKTIDEILNADYSALNGQLTYIFTLKGNSTLYYNSDDDIHNEFINSTIDTRLDFSCNPDISCSIHDKIDLSKVLSPDFGQGAVHLSSKNYGTIHSPPPMHQRLVAIIIPEKSEVIEKHHKEIHDYTISLLKS